MLQPRRRYFGACLSLRARVFHPPLVLSRNCQVQGVGTVLLRSLEAWLPMPWHLKCVERNVDALAFYLSQGWVEENRAEGPKGGYVLLKKSEA